MRRSLLLLVAVALSMPISTPARAARGRASLALGDWLDPDAPVIAAVAPAALPALSRLATAVTGNSELQNSLLELLTTTLEGDPLSPKVWRGAGIDPNSPAMFALGAIDAAETERVFEALLAADPWSDIKLRKIRKVFWRHRIAIRITNHRAAARTVRRFAKALPVGAAVSDKHGPAIAMMVGATPRKAPKILRDLTKHHISAVGWIPGLDALVTVRVDSRRKVMLIDVIGSYAGIPIAWERNRKQILDVITSNPGRSGVAKRLSTGAGAKLERADLRLWIRGEALYDAAVATSRHQVLRAVASASGRQRATVGRIGTTDVASCGSLRALVTHGAFDDVALGLWTAPAGPELRVVWTMRSGYGLAKALTIHDDGLGPGPLEPSAIATIQLPLTGFARLRALPRPPVLREGTAHLMSIAYRCGAGSAVISALFGWPALVGARLDELATEHPVVGALLTSARNVSIAVRESAGEHWLGYGVAAASFRSQHAEETEKALDGLFGPHTPAALGDREAVVWTADAQQIFATNAGSNLRLIGLGAGTGALPWFFGAQAKPAPNSTIAELFVNLSQWYPEGGTGWGRLHARLNRTGSRLTATITAELPDAP